MDRSDVAVYDEMRQLFLGVAEMVDEMLAGAFCLFVRSSFYLIFLSHLVLHQ